MTAWTKENLNSKERENMYIELGALFKDKKLTAPPHKLVPFCQYQEAVLKALSSDGKTGIKYILDMTKN